MAYKIPVYQSQEGLVVPPAQMPFASVDTGSIAAKAAEVTGLETAQNLEKATKSLGEIGLYHKNANDSSAAWDAFTNSAVAVRGALRDAPDYETFEKTAQDVRAKARASLPSMEAQGHFDKISGYFFTQSLVQGQHKFYTEGILKQVGSLHNNLDTLLKEINNSPTPEIAAELTGRAEGMVNSAIANRLLTAPAGENLKIGFNKRIWFGMVERRVQDDPVGTLQELHQGDYNDVLDPHQLTALYDTATRRINTENRMVKLEDRETERQAKLGAAQQLNYFMGRVLDAQGNNENPMKIYQEAASANLDQGALNRIHRAVLGSADRQIKDVRSSILKQLQLPADLDTMIARKTHLAGVDMNALNQYNEAMGQVRSLVVHDGVGADLAGRIVLYGIKERQLKNPIADLTPQASADYAVPDGFQGNPNDTQALLNYGTLTQTRIDQGLITPAQGMLAQNMIRARLAYLQRVTKAPAKPQAGPAKPGASAPAPMDFIP
jgi:hypothetical protein